MNCSTPDFRRLLKLMSIKAVMPSNHLIHCRPLLPPSNFPSIRIFSNESVLRKYIHTLFEFHVNFKYIHTLFEFHVNFKYIHTLFGKELCNCATTELCILPSQVSGVGGGGGCKTQGTLTAGIGAPSPVDNKLCFSFPGYCPGPGGEDCGGRSPCKAQPVGTRPYQHHPFYFLLLPLGEVTASRSPFPRWAQMVTMPPCPGTSSWEAMR